tara:strand:+ start:1231 stop:1707 length:477 start_codon:yes stop_codon:yes gene_type:complete
MKNKKQLPLRKGVGIVLLNEFNQIFVGKRIDNPTYAWQMPQGGIDENENLHDAAKRELFEETSIKSTKLIKELNYWLDYNLPSYLLGKIWKGKFRGQTQKWFFMKFMGKEDEININTKNPEFKDWKWVNKKDLVNIAVNFKIEIYKNLKLELEKLNLD